MNYIKLEEDVDIDGVKLLKDTIVNLVKKGGDLTIDTISDGEVRIPKDTKYKEL